MKLHRLEIRAFGPFGGSEIIDFDALGAHGLFLMHGPTGSGKTSVLDAVCFALFASVPGARRSQTERLVSDHAQPGTTPQVCLEFTVAVRRLRVTRSPSHRAPKKRGTGTTRRQPKVLLEERLAGGWSALSARADEVGDTLHQLLGLGLEQFAQVVLLPQGEFAAFLHAKADDRATLLEKLFDVSRFRDLEQWLTETRRSSRAALVEVDSAVQTAVVRAEESLVDLAPTLERWRTLPATDLPAQIGVAMAQVSDRLTSDLARLDAATTALEAAERAHAAGVVTDRLQKQADAAAIVRQRWEQQADERRAAQRRLDASERARRVLPALRAEQRARTRLESATEKLAATVALLPAGDDHAALQAAVSDAEAPLVEAEQAQRVVVRCTEQIPQLTAEVRRAQASIATVTERRRALDERRAVLLATTRSAQDVLAGETLLQTKERTLTQWKRLSERCAESARAVSAAEQQSRSASEQFARFERTVLELRSRRLAGFAGELAGQLEPEHPCPVCGSTDHPSPADAAAAVSQDQIDAAEKDASQARHRAQTAAHELAGAEATTAALKTQLDEIASQWLELTSVVLDPTRLASVEAQLLTERRIIDSATGVLEASQREHSQIESAIEGLDQQIRTAEQTRDRTEAQLQAVRAHGEDAASLRQAALARHEAVCPCSAGDTATLAAHQSLTSRLQEWALATHESARLTQEHHDATESLDAALIEHGFDSVEAVIEACLALEAEQTLRDELASAHDQAQRAQGVLDQPEVRAALEAPRPDLAAAAETSRRAHTDERAARSTYEAARRAVDSLRRLSADVDQLLGRSADLRARMCSLDRLADLVSGAGDNALRMRLSAYVLAARLDQVTALANHRLDTMSAGRYQLEHTDARAKGGVRSGLGLQVRDAWTGTARDTATLSGGETFMVSLAMALGLGEAVLHDAGGRPLETLLVDEGFGTLDEESLELVMQVLDDLRSGGRTVGIVSHVSELRSRVPAQIKVHKTEQGSRVEVRVGDASSAA